MRSLVRAVGATALVGFLHRRKLGEVELRTGLMFAVAGMLGAPVGTWLASRLPEPMLLLSFAALMLTVFPRMWRQSVRAPSCSPSRGLQAADPDTACQRDEKGALVLTPRCATLLLVTGVMTGVLSGMFGVGGGFIILPALMLFRGMSMHEGVGTSLMVVALVSVSGMASQLWAGRSISVSITTQFILGGIGGLFVGQQISHRVSGPTLQKLFAVAIVLVAVFVILSSLQASTCS